MRSLLILSLMATPSFGADVTATNCTISEKAARLVMPAAAVDCDVNNSTDTAVAALTFRIIGKQPDRTVPWVDDKGAMNVDGGIEPGETRRLLLIGNFASPDSLQKPGLTFTVEITEAEDVDGKPIE